jgi:hypothetical protein
VSHDANMARTPHETLQPRQFAPGELAARAQAIKAKAMVRAMPTRTDTGQQYLPLEED